MEVKPETNSSLGKFVVNCIQVRSDFTLIVFVFYVFLARIVVCWLRLPALHVANDPHSLYLFNSVFDCVQSFIDSSPLTISTLRSFINVMIHYADELREKNIPRERIDLFMKHWSWFIKLVIQAKLPTDAMIEEGSTSQPKSIFFEPEHKSSQITTADSLQRWREWIELAIDTLFISVIFDRYSSSDISDTSTSSQTSAFNPFSLWTDAWADFLSILFDSVPDSEPILSSITSRWVIEQQSTEIIPIDLHLRLLQSAVQYFINNSQQYEKSEIGALKRLCKMVLIATTNKG